MDKLGEQKIVGILFSNINSLTNTYVKCPLVTILNSKFVPGQHHKKRIYCTSLGLLFEKQENQENVEKGNQIPPLDRTVSRLDKHVRFWLQETQSSVGQSPIS